MTDDVLDGLVLFCRRDDQDLGELDEIVEVGGRPYVVVDARHWSFGARKLVPLDAIELIEGDDRRAVTDADRESVRLSPDFDPFQLANPNYVERVDGYFGTW